jgi:hypothetical protein
MTITFNQLQNYLDAIAAKANLNVGDSRHGVFWRVSYSEFKDGFVPNKRCEDLPVPILDPVDLSRSAFFTILQSSFCGMPKMPKTGPFVIDPEYTVVLPDGSTVSGQTIISDIKEWLEAGAPEAG